MTEAVHEDASESRPWRGRPWRIAGGIVALLVGVLAYVCFTDCAPPDDADLLPAPTRHAAMTNPLTLFCKGVGNAARREFSALPPGTETFDKGQEAVLQKFAAAHDRERTLVQELMKSDPTTWSWPDGEQEKNSTYSWLDAFGAARVCEAYTVALARSGRSDEAVEEALMVARFGHFLYQAPDHLGTVRESLKTQCNGETLLLESLRECRDGEQLKRMQDTLAGLEPSATVFAISMRETYVEFKLEMQKLESDPKMWDRYFGADRPRALLFRINRSLHLFGEWLRPVLRGLEGDWLTALRAMEKSSLDAGIMREVPWKRLLTMNGLGTAHAIECWRYMAGYFANSVVSRVAQHRMTVVALAMRRFELEHGRLPSKLQEMVPAFMAEVPLDPFSNRPLHWDASKRTLYSVGANGVDDGGDEALETYPGSRSIYDPGVPRDVVLKYELGR